MVTHTPDLSAEDSILIANPFGYERKVKRSSASLLLEKSKSIEKFLTHWQQGGSVSHALTLEKRIRSPFENAVIRTGRSLNDITLADHAISTAALAAAHAARLVLEADIGKVSDNMYYSLPVRRKQLDWPQTAFAAFSCAVNADKLDQMALELKDITAIRDEVYKLLEHFLYLFSEKYPVGGGVYRDQHGAHLVVPILGDSARRWVRGEKKDSSIHPGETPDINWQQAPEDALTNEEFVCWLFATAKKELTDFNVNFGVELLVGLRYAMLGQKLNMLAKAICWTRSLSSLSIMAGEEKGEEIKIHTFNYGRAYTSKVTFDLCGVCGLRQGVPANQHRKCGICSDRVKREHSQKVGQITLAALSEKTCSLSMFHRPAL